MTFKYINRAIRWGKEHNLSSSQRLVLLMLSFNCNHKGAVWDLSQSKLAEACGISRARTCTLIGELKALGLLTSVRKKAFEANYFFTDKGVFADEQGVSADEHLDKPKSDPPNTPPHLPRKHSPSSTSSQKNYPYSVGAPCAPGGSSSSSGRRVITPEEGRIADRILSLYPKYRTTRKQKAICRGLIHRLVDKGLTLAQIEGRVQDLADCYEDFSQDREPLIYGPLKFFADIELVTDPMTWRHLFMRDGDEDDWDEYLTREGIDSEPTTYGESEE